MTTEKEVVEDDCAKLSKIENENVKYVKPTNLTFVNVEKAKELISDKLNSLKVIYKFFPRNDYKIEQ